jgi:hypothetical protein
MDEELESTCYNINCKTRKSLALYRDHKIATIMREKRKLYVTETTIGVGDEEVILTSDKQHELIFLSV